MKIFVENLIEKGKDCAWQIAMQVRCRAFRKEPGLDGILVTVGLCIIALVLCVVMKESMSKFITTLVTDMTTQAQGILQGTTK